MAIRRGGSRIVQIMRRIFPILLFILTLSLLSASLSYGQVQVRLRVFEASNVGTGIDSSLRDMRVKIKREQMDILNTQVRLSPGRTVSIGGPKHGEGVIIITLSAQF